MKRRLKAGLLAACLLCATAALSAVTLIDFESGYAANQPLPGNNEELVDSAGTPSGVRVRSADGVSLSILSRPGADPAGSGLNWLQALQPQGAGFGPDPFLTLDFIGLSRANRVSGEIWGLDSATAWSILATFSDGSTARTSSSLFPDLFSGSVGGALLASPATFSFGSSNATVATLDITVENGFDSNAGAGVLLDNVTVAPVPLPIGAVLLLSGLAAVGALRYRWRL